MSIGILSAGRALGSRIEPNEELCRYFAPSLGITPEWVVSKTGITQRYKALEGETTATLAAKAAQQALERAGTTKVDMVVVCTAFNDYHFPSVAARLNRDLNLGASIAYDLNANCSGYIAALIAVSDRMKADPSIEYGLVVGAEVLSPYIDQHDPGTAPFFSDGAGAVVLQHQWDGGIVSSAFSMDTAAYEAVRCKRGGRIEQQGLVTWKTAVANLPGVIRTAVERAGWAMTDVDVFVPHQANLVLLEFLAARLGWKDKLYTNVQTVGNCGAASGLVGLADAMEAGILVPDKKVVLAGIGAGFSFGAICWEV